MPTTKISIPIRALFLHKNWQTISGISSKSYRNSTYPLALAMSNYPKDLWEVEDIEEATKRATYRLLNFIFGSVEVSYGEFCKHLEEENQEVTLENMFDLPENGQLQ